MKHLLSKSAFLAAISASPFVLAADSSQFEIYGFAQLDLIQDFGRMDPDWKDTTRPSKIDAQGNKFGDDGESILSIRQSRLGFKGDMLTGETEAKLWIEWDYFGGTADSPDLQLRHFLIEIDRYAAGKSWTGFMDIDIFPNTIDYWGPNGMVFIRKEQLRYQLPINQSSHLFFTLEDPGADVDTDNAITNNDLQTKSSLPDFTARFRHDADWGHWQIAGILRSLEVELPDQNFDDSTIGFGINATTVFTTIGDDKVKLGLVTGQGIASNFNDGGNTLALEKANDPKIKALKSLGISAYYDRYWSKQWSSSFGFSLHEQDNTDIQADNAYKSGQLAQANLLYQEKALTTGAELIWSTREDKNGESNDDLRIQYSVKYNFSHIF